MTHFKTYREILEACQKCKTREDAARVLALAKADNLDHAEENIGYLLGYLGASERQRLYALFATCNHPIFGKCFGRGYDPAPDEALAKGKETAMRTS